MKALTKHITGLCLVAALGACAAPHVTSEGAGAFMNKSEDEILPVLPGAQVMAAFEAVCDRNLSDLNRAKAQLDADGYIKVSERPARGGKDHVEIYAHPDGKPLFSIGGDTAANPELCIAMFRETDDAVRAMERYVSRKGGKAPDLGLPMDNLPFQFWSAPGRLYIKVVEKTGPFGSTVGLGVGKD